MPVAGAAVEKRLAVRLVLRGVVKPARLVVLGDAIALDVAKVRSGGINAAASEFDDPRLDDDAPIGRPEAVSGAPVSERVIATPIR